VTAALASRGYAVLYRTDEVNHCPGCGHVNWHLGRSSAECAFCGTALPYAPPAPLNGRASPASSIMKGHPR
jgi:ribosomal protein S27E